MKFAVITLFPEMLAAFLSTGVVGRAKQQGLIDLFIINPRDYAVGNYRKVDARPFGGGPGMVMMAEPLVAAISASRKLVDGAEKKAKVIYLSPQGRRLDQEQVVSLKHEGNLILLAGRYEGIDQRVIDHFVDDEISIGDFVLSGGELPAMVLVDAIARTIEGVLGHDESAQNDSFSHGLLDCPHYTKPVAYKGLSVPAVLRGGNHQAIKQWREKQAFIATYQKRPDLLDKKVLTKNQQLWLDELKLITTKTSFEQEPDDEQEQDY